MLIQFDWLLLEQIGIGSLLLGLDTCSQLFHSTQNGVGFLSMGEVSANEIIQHLKAMLSLNKHC